MKASYLGKVIEYFNPMQSLDESQRDWYVERPDSPHDELKVFLLNDPTPAKILFSGRTGSGKSSTLNRMVDDAEIQRRFFTVKFSVKEELNIADLSYTDLLVAFGNRLFQAADSLSLPQRLRDDLNQWAAEVSKAWGITDLAEATVEGGIRAWFLSATGKLKTGHEEKREFRQKIEPRIPQLIQFINRIIHAVQVHPTVEGRQVLVVIEDLDKPPVDIALDLFLTKSSTLVEPQCKILFTVPTSVLYSGKFNAVRQNFSKQFVLPNFKIEDRSGQPDKPARECMKEIVTRRLDPQLIETKALDRAVEMSGGVVRELIRMVNTAASRALVTNSNSIKEEHVSYAIDDLRRIYSYSLTKQEYVTILQQVHATKLLRYEKEEPLLELLHGQFILQYPNGAGWYGVNPIVHELIGVK